MQSSAVRLLAVDDDPVTLTLYKSVFEKIGFEVTAVENAEDGLEKFFNRAFPICIIDWMLPGIDGIEMVRRIRAAPEGEDSILIMITAKNQQSDLETILEAGANDYIEKPVNPHQLRVRMKIALKMLQNIEERREGERNAHLMTQAFDNSEEGIMITSPDNKILYVNKAFSVITGFSAGEAMDENPNLLASGKHERSFFKQMWTSLKEGGTWQGEIWNKRKTGEIFPEWLNINVVRDDHGEIINYVGQFHDLSISKRNEERLNYLANHDILTDLPNRSYLVELLALSIDNSAKGNEDFAVLMLDLDRFKIVNDSLSHGVGDLLLQGVAGRLQTLKKKYSFLSRSGGDEFVIIKEKIHGPADAANLAQEVLDLLKEPFNLNENELFASASIGIALFPEDGKDSRTLLRNADLAMYRAKEGGRNKYQFYSPEMNHLVFEKMTLETSLRKSIEIGNFRLVFQPFIKASNECVTGMEALVRWVHPDMGIVSPAQFISIAEDTGLIVPLGSWVLRQSLIQAKELFLPHNPDLAVSINVSGKQFYDPGFLDVVKNSLAETGFPPEHVDLELTESIFMEDIDETVKMLYALKDLGVQLAIDDFGTGYSSFQYLKKLPIDILKIDRSFTRDIGKTRQDDAIIHAIISVGKSLNMKLIAEGVEDEVQKQFLTNNGVDFFQGYYYTPPLPGDEFSAYISKNCPDAPQ